VLLRTGKIIWLLVIVTLSIGISAAIEASSNSSIGSAEDLSSLIPYGDTIKNNLWFITAIACIIAFLSFIVVVLSFFIGPGIFRDKIRFFRSKMSDIEGVTRRREYYRHEMIKNVRNIWIKDYLSNSLHNIVTIELGLDECRDKIDFRGNLVVEGPNRVQKQLPSSTNVIEVFDELGGSFLVMGGPGSGKTILLLQLARGLLDRADGDDRLPIPVVFHLSTWAVRRPHLADWLVDELAMRYNVNRGLGEKWVNEDSILPLLDGLDEVSREYREACVEAINKFRKEHGLLPLVVCSRKEEYDALKLRLNLQTAIVVKPLTRPQIEQHLKSIGTPMEGVQVALQNDQVLWELLETPLMLNIVALAFKGKSAESVRGIDELNGRRRQLFEAYENAMFERPGRSSAKSCCYTPQQMKHWLSWLASSMKQHDQSIFYMELLQPSWLPSLRLQKVTTMSMLFIWPAFGLLICLAFWQLFWITIPPEPYPWANLIPGLQLLLGLSFGLIGGLVFLLAMGLLFRWVGKPSMKRAEILHFLPATKLFDWLASWLVLGLAIGLVIGLVNGPSTFIQRIDYMVFWLVIGLIFGLIGGLATAIEHEELNIRTYPNEGIRASGKNALIMGLVGLFIWTAPWLIIVLADREREMFVLIGLISGVFFGLAEGLVYGGYIYFQHYLLRIVLRICNLAPLDYVTFLDYAADRVFLQKVGGGYVFIHRMVMDYFASLVQDEAEAKT